MTTGKVSALTAGFIGAFAVGVAIGPFVTRQGDSRAAAPAALEISRPLVETGGREAKDLAPPARGPKIAREARPKDRASQSKVASWSDKASPRPAQTVAASAPALGVRLKPVLTRGANMTLAAEGFRDAEQFAAVAHAARNARVPFMVLKHHVLDEKQSLADAIRAANPSLDADAEARRARTQARSDLAAVAPSAAN